MFPLPARSERLLALVTRDEPLAARIERGAVRSTSPALEEI